MCALVQTKMEAARAKAEAISGQEDLPMNSKMKEIQKLMAKARASGKGKGKKKATRRQQSLTSIKRRSLWTGE